MTDQTCQCVGVKDAIGLALKNQEQPHCAQHDSAASDSAIALNDDSALAARLGMTLRKGNL